MNVSFEKYTATGNDFLLIDGGSAVADRRTFARVHCDDQDGEGVDGVLFLDIRDDGESKPVVAVELYQPDGGSAAMCGNGARCVAHWAADRTGADRLSVRYASGVYDAVVDGDRVTVEMGVPSVTPADVPLARDEPMIDEDYRGFSFTAVNVGVPHVVSFVGDVADIDVEGVSPRIRHGDRFPEGTNVNFASVDPDGGFRQRTYERGVEGETDSCGTGAVAIAKAAIETGRFSGDSVVVSPPGGDLEVGIPADGAATLAGPVEREYNGTLPVPETTNTQPTA